MDNNLLTALTTDLAIIIYESVGLLVSISLCIFFRKKMKNMEAEREKNAISRQYSALENSLKNDKRR